MTLARRSFLTGLVGLVAAPAIVRVASIMPVRAMVEPDPYVIMVHPDMWRDLVEAQNEINRRRSKALAIINRRWITRDEALEMFPAN